MPQQSSPQNAQPNQPVSPPGPPDSTGGGPQQGVPPQAGGRATPPGGTPGPQGYVPPQAAYSVGPARDAGRTFASDDFGPVPGRAMPGPGYPSAPGYGPAAAPGYAPGNGSAARSGQPGPVRPTQAFAVGETATVAAAPEPKKKDLTLNKLIAGAGAAATSAVLGSFFGALGTVGGAALGSVFSAVVTSLYQHSLDKTRDTVKAKVKLPGGGTLKVTGTPEVPGSRSGTSTSTTRVFVTPGDQPTEVMAAVPAVDAGPPRSRRRLLVMTGFTVVVFAIGMLAITGIELVKGSPLNSSSNSSSTSERSGGTSLGSVLGRSESSEPSTETATPSNTASATPSSEATTSEDRDEDGSSAVPNRGFGADEDEDAPSTSSARVTPTPTPTPQSGADGQSDEVGQSDGGAGRQQGGGAAGSDAQQ